MDPCPRHFDTLRSLTDLWLELSEVTGHLGRQVVLLDVTARYAWALYHDLNSTGVIVLMSPESMKSQLPLSPDDSDFFRSLEIIDDFIAQAHDTICR
jgi:hypothetical protein